MMMMRAGESAWQIAQRNSIYSSCCCLFDCAVLCHSLEIFLDVLGLESFGSLLVVSDETCHNSDIAYSQYKKKKATESQE